MALKAGGSGGFIDDVELLDLPVDDVETFEPIDMDSISDDAVDEAEKLVANISNLQHCDDEFLSKNPRLKKRIESEIESLRVLIKMRKADEVTHDILIKAISGNSGNASLYRSLSELQKTILQITTKMQETVNGLNTLLKDFQMELNFQPYEDEDENSNQEEQDSNENTSRGSKDFISKQIMKNDNLIR